VTEARSLVLLLRARRVDTGAAVPVSVSMGARRFDPVRIDGEWAEQRFTLTPSELAPALTIELPGEARLAIDHALLVPAP
jgi:hypothetical protein